MLGAVLTGSSGAVGSWRKSRAYSPDLGNQRRLLGGGDILAERDPKGEEVISTERGGSEGLEQRKGSET